MNTTQFIKNFCDKKGMFLLTLLVFYFMIAIPLTVLFVESDNKLFVTQAGFGFYVFL